MEIALMADLHIGLHRKNPIFYEIAEEFLNFFSNYVISNSIKKVFILGDIFDKNYKVPNRQIIMFKNFIKRMIDNWITVYVISGNHDIYIHQGIDENLLQIFDEIILVERNSKKISIEDKEILMIPYFENVNDIIKEIDNNNADILFTHIGYNGFEMAPKFLEKDGIPIDKVNKFNLVISGHLHKHQKINNIVYIGNAFQYKMTDRLQKKGFLVLETDNLNYKFIEFKNTSKFYVINKKENIEKMIELTNKIKNPIFIEIRLNETIDEEKIRNKFPKNVQEINFKYDLSYDDILENVSLMEIDDIIINIINKKYENSQKTQKIINEFNIIKGGK